MPTLSRAIRRLLAKHKDTALARRWEEATSFGEGARADAFWLRESEDVVNVVWLNSDGIRDITLLPTSEEAMFNFLPLQRIVTFEVREGKDTARHLGLDVKGDMVILVIIEAPRGQLYIG